MPVLKTISIGDIHGNDAWKKIDTEKYDRIIFVGDYTDHFTRSNETIINNLRSIIELKNQYPEKVILLLGNHDLGYMYPNDSRFRCSGYRPELSLDLGEVFQKNRHLFQCAYQIENYLWTHSGMTYEYYYLVYTPLKEKFLKSFQVDPLTNDGMILSMMGFTKEIGILNYVSRSRGGADPYPGIFWADQSEHIQNIIKGNVTPFHQICGHSRVKEITSYAIKNDESSITLIDCLDTITEFYEKDIEVNE